MRLFNKLSMMMDIMSDMNEQNKANQQNQNAVSQDPQKPAIDGIVEYFANVISFTDYDVMSEIKQCLSDPHSYYVAHQSEYEDYCIDDESENLVKWYGFMIALRTYDYAFDVKSYSDKNYFASKMAANKSLMKMSLEFDTNWINETDSITKWCSDTEVHWAAQKACICTYDNGTDEGFLFVTTQFGIEKMMPLAQKEGFKIYRMVE